MVQLVKIYCGDLSTKEQIWGSVTSNKVFGSCNKLTGWFDLIFIFCYSKCCNLVISTMESRGNYNCYSIQNGMFGSKFAVVLFNG